LVPELSASRFPLCIPAVRNVHAYLSLEGGADFDYAVAMGASIWPLRVRTLARSRNTKREAGSG